jgi:hypothetical protein
MEKESSVESTESTFGSGWVSNPPETLSAPQRI